ncbi:hypothetical protein DFH08DRAFT_813261 [Mycena albidolilacea]|uniref:Uncharacterized protein n=1 Tax=Mycena albidolilacea TaxID=1033008 RepID=A0AAD6ZTT1_9AGAR|nr:hypothetical protein DFH08DRAFT_813261 [Mycena albidolilacea]
MAVGHHGTGQPITLSLLSSTQATHNLAFTNIKVQIVSSNIRDPYTLIELAVLAVYGQAITYPYIAWKARTNILTLDPLHSKLLAHSGLLISSPDLLCGPEALYRTGALDSQQWEHPERAHSRPGFFTAEFTSKGSIASLSAGEQDSAAMLSTNDANEGTLGADARVAKRQAPRAGLEFINGKSMYKRNNTQVYAAQNLRSPTTQAYVCAAARTIDGEHREKNCCLEQAAADVQTVTEHRVGKDKRNKKRAKEQAEIDKCPVIFDTERFREEESLRVAKVLVNGKSEIPAVSKLKKKEKAAVLIAALERWNACVASGEFPQRVPPRPDAVEESRKAESNREDEEMGYEHSK